MKEISELLIDTNVIIDFTNNLLPINSANFIEELESYISIITRIELLSWDKLTTSDINIINDIIEDSNIIDLNENIILKTIEIRKKYKTKLADAIIAATSIINDLTLITNNTKDFSKIVGLKLINPYEI